MSTYSEERYPIKYHHERSLYRKYLRDVDGRVVRGDHGEPLHLYAPNIRDYIESGQVRFIYDLPKEYRYIVTSQEQYHRFQKERAVGSPYKNKYYFIYPDDDTTMYALHPKRRVSGPGWLWSRY